MSIDTHETLSHDYSESQFANGNEYAKLTESPGESSELTDEQLEELAFADSRVIAGTERVLELRKAHRSKEADAAVIENRAVLAAVMDELRINHGQATVAEQHEAAEAERLTQLAELSVDQATGMTNEEQLKYFGLLDDDGQVVLDSPLIATKTKRAFDVYLRSVEQTEAMSRVANEQGLRVKGFIEADRERAAIHDAVAHSLADDLGIEFEDARKMVAKARDRVKPGHGESAMYGFAALKKLEKAGNDLSYGVIDAHKSIDRILAAEDKLDETSGSETGAVGLTEPIKLGNPVADIIDSLRNAGKNEYQQRAETLITEIKQGIAKNSLSETIDYLRDEYLDRPQDDIELQRLTQLILRARQQAVLQDKLNQDRESLHNDPLTHEENVSVGNHYEMLRREACEFNHSLRLLMENNGHHFTRDQLTEWIGQASQGRYRWAEGEVTGAASELAVHAALQGMVELKEVRYGSVDEDLAGYDFVCKWQGKLLSIDAKTGHYPPVEERKHGHKHIEVSVPREVIKNFTVSRRGLERIRHDVRNALGESNGTVHHVSHRYYARDKKLDEAVGKD